MTDRNALNDNEQIVPPSEGFSRLDLDALFNLRTWVEEAIRAKGGKIVGAGIGEGGKMGRADLQVELAGHQFNLEIQPL